MKHKIAKYDRHNYFDNVGSDVTEAHSVNEVLHLAQLDYEVYKKDIFLSNGTIIDEFKCTIKSNDDKQLGIVGKNYGIIQNHEAFDFLDSMHSSGMEFETAGSYKDDKATFILGKTENFKILGDDFAPYILFQNSFDGSGSVKVMFTPTRVFCSNTLSVALQTSQRLISVRHNENVKSRLETAKMALFKNTEYLTVLNKECERWAQLRFTKKQFVSALPLLIEHRASNNDKLSDERTELITNEIMKAYNRRDLSNHPDSAYRAIQAISDYESHYAPFRDTGNQFTYLQRIAAGMTMLQLIIKIIEQQGRRRFI